MTAEMNRGHKQENSKQLRVLEGECWQGTGPEADVQSCRAGGEGEWIRCFRQKAALSQAEWRGLAGSQWKMRLERKP